MFETLWYMLGTKKGHVREMFGKIKGVIRDMLGVCKIHVRDLLETYYGHAGEF